MVEWTPEHWLTVVSVGLGTGGSGGVLAWVFSRRQSKADAALTEVQVAREALTVVRESLAELRGDVIRQGEEIAKIKQELRTTERERSVLVQYTEKAWRHYDRNPDQAFPDSLPENRPKELVAIVRPELAKQLLTGSIPIQPPPTEVESDETK